MRYRIGEFAELAGVSGKTLRHYDRVGLLRPAAVDARTRYRYYSSAQLGELSTILAMRELGLSLAQIRAFVRRTEGMGHIDRRALLLCARQNLEKVIQKARQSLGDVDAALNVQSGEPGARVAPVWVVIKRCRGMRVASVRVEMESYVEAEVLRLERELLGALPSESLGSVRGVLWQRSISNRLIAEPFVEVNHVLPRRTSYDLKVLPPVTAACTFSANDEVAADHAYRGIGAWMSTRDLSLKGPKREIYLGEMLQIQAPLSTP